MFHVLGVKTFSYARNGGRHGGLRRTQVCEPRNVADDEEGIQTEQARGTANQKVRYMSTAPYETRVFLRGGT